MSNRVIIRLGAGDETIERTYIRVPDDGEEIDLDGRRFTDVGSVITRLSGDLDPTRWSKSGSSHTSGPPVLRVFENVNRL